MSPHSDSGCGDGSYKLARFYLFYVSGKKRYSPPQHEKRGTQVIYCRDLSKDVLRLPNFYFLNTDILILQVT